MKPLSSKALEHLAALRTMDAPPADAAAAVWDGVLTRAAAGDLGPELPVEPASPATAAGATSIKSIALGVLVGAGVAIGGIAALALGDDEPAVQALAPGLAGLPAATPEPAPIEVPVVAPIPNAAEAVIEPEQAEPEQAEPEQAEPADPEPVDRSVSRPKVARPEAKPAGDGIAEEVALLAEARGALGAGEAKRAIGVLARHAKRFPSGVLARERDVSWITALCVLGKVDQARAKAEVFLRAHGNSPHAAKVRASCGGTD